MFILHVNPVSCWFIWFIKKILVLQIQVRVKMVWNAVHEKIHIDVEVEVVLRGIVSGKKARHHSRGIEGL